MSYRVGRRRRNESQPGFLGRAVRFVGAMFFGGLFLVGGWPTSESDDLWLCAFFLLFSLLFLSLPLIEHFLRDRPAQISCPTKSSLGGHPAIRFPADRKGMQISVVCWAWFAAVCVTGAAAGEAEPSGVIWFPAAALAAFFLSFPLFALTGRFVEDGTYLSERGVTIRARGLRAEIPWPSIAGARTVTVWPFPYPRVAIDLKPGTPRDVSVTVPWWIGSPRPRRNTVFLTEVQVPGMHVAWEQTNPAEWIALFAQAPPSRELIEKLADPPTLQHARDHIQQRYAAG